MAETAETAAKMAAAGGRTEVAVAIILSISGLMTAWASYQGALWDGKQAEHYNSAGEVRTIAARVGLEVDNWKTQERELFGRWLEASLRGDDELANFYKSRFPDDMRPSFERWMATDPLTNPRAPAGPLMMPGYRPFGADRSEALDREADAATRRGEKANAVSDRFTQGSLFMSTAMFFGGISQVFTLPRVRVGLLVVAAICCAAGLLRILSLPMLRPD